MHVIKKNKNFHAIILMVVFISFCFQRREKNSANIGTRRTIFAYSIPSTIRDLHPYEKNNARTNRTNLSGEVRAIVYSKGEAAVVAESRTEVCNETQFQNRSRFIQFVGIIYAVEKTMVEMHLPDCDLIKWKCKRRRSWMMSLTQS